MEWAFTEPILRSETIAEMATTDAYVDLIMTPVQRPWCYGHISTVCRILRENGFDVSAAANALARWLCAGPVDVLYVQPYNWEVGNAFFEDLAAALTGFVEVNVTRNVSEVLRLSGKKLVLLPPFRNPPTIYPRHVIFRFMNTLAPVRRFTRQCLASFVYCGNTEDGPLNKYECMEDSGLLCIRASISLEHPCGNCFSNGIKGRLRNMLVPATIEDNQDEGVVCTPLGVHEEIYVWEPPSEDSDSDTE